MAHFFVTHVAHAINKVVMTFTNTKLDLVAQDKMKIREHEAPTLHSIPPGHYSYD
ncbi:hypothetical protein COEREDRAFT_92719 [Coemansia reversa NRRL 1564]|uniref:Uncharacterized protein n=1 Tax=Coemansia reversa (strain ATCC 12441 / NRRL 1564) TaxID=763665 RepID=A0A2G5BB20_COERN|nr:hypothetical protein COEREDRAFT_92719 [Coemansia reversa NRRL 1564]|eukprot:PIA16206.1 hypothetical protein COEREDRAFT_92719 [Coemansia reversa NRRL 1564]